MTTPTPAERLAAAKLTDRQIAIVTRLMAGTGHRAIARDLIVSEQVVYTDVAKARRKLGLATTIEMAVLCAQAGLEPVGQTPPSPPPGPSTQDRVDARFRHGMRLSHDTDLCGKCKPAAASQPPDPATPPPAQPERNTVTSTDRSTTP